MGLSVNTKKKPSTELWTHQKNNKRVWTRGDGQILTNESFGCGGNKIKMFFVYANSECRGKGINYTSGESVTEAKSNVLPVADALKLSGVI